MASSSQVSQSPFPGVPVSSASIIEVVTGPKYTLKFLNLQDTPHLYFDTVNQLLVYNSFDISEVDVSTQFYLIPTDGNEMGFVEPNNGTPRRCRIDSVVNPIPTNMASLEPIGVGLYNVVFKPGRTAQEFIVVRESDNNFSFSVDLKSDGIAYMMPSTSKNNKDVVMSTHVGNGSEIINLEIVG